MIQGFQASIETEEALIQSGRFSDHSLLSNNLTFTSKILYQDS